MNKVETLLNALGKRGICVVRDKAELCLSAPKGVIKPEDVAQLRANKAAILSYLAKNGASHAEAELRPLPEQAAILRAFGGGAHLVTAFFKLHPAPSIHAARSAIRAVLRRHDAFNLRCVLTDKGDPRLCTGFNVSEPRVVDFSGIEAPLHEGLFKQIVTDEFRRGLDLRQQSGLRLCLVTQAGKVVALSLVTHHAVMDRWSMDILATELQAALSCHENGEPWLEPIAPSYAQFIAAQNAVSEGQSEQSSRPEQQEATSLLDLFSNGSGVSLIGSPARQYKASFDATLSHSLRQCGRRSATIAAALAVVLRRYSDTGRLELGVPQARRSDPKLQKLVGLLSHTAVMSLNVSPKQTGAGLIADVSACLNDILVQEPEEADGGAALPQVILSFQNTAIASDTGRFRYEMPKHSFCKTDLVVFVSEDSITLEYPVEFVDRDEIARLAHDILEQMRGLLRDKNRLLADYDPPPETSSGQLPLGEPVSLLSAFTEHALATPDAIAVEDHAHVPTRYVTYRKLLSYVASIAAGLRARGMCAETVVALRLHNPFNRISAVLAVLWAGGAYAPLRSDDNIKASTGLVITDDAELPKAPNIIEIDTLLNFDKPDAFSGPTLVPRKALAWTLPTSGSTGPCKHVVLDRGNAEAFVSWVRSAYSAEDLRRTLVVTPLTFDLSVFEIFAPLSTGGTAVALESPLSLARLIGRAEPSLINTTPSIFRDLLATGPKFEPSTVVNLAGEVLDQDLIRAIRAAGISRLFNLYGPSEATTYTTVAEIDFDTKAATAPIGVPIEGWRIRLDQQTSQSGLGLWRGEITIGGLGVGRGYMDAPASTAAAFLPDIDGTSGQRRYWSGDRAYWNGAGWLHFLGREDRQIKRRGIRVELDSVEAVLWAQPFLSDAAARVEQTTRGPRITAYIVAPGIKENDIPSLLAQVPSTLLPDETILLDQLPLTPSGKIDRLALTSYSSRSKPENHSVLSDQEQEIAQIWTDLTGRPVTEASARFFDSGGDSLMLMRVAHLLEQRFGLKVSPLDLLRRPTVSDVADLLPQNKPVYDAPVHREASL